MNCDLIDLIDHGSYGHVYRCKVSPDINYAVKIINTDKVNIVELTIMNMFKHPYINNAHEIYVTSKEVWIIQDMADYALSDCDVSEIDLDIRNNWINNIIRAVKCLHDNKFIHGDIKPANILYKQYDNSIKLTDFGMSLYACDTNELYTHTVCTHNYRPIEATRKGIKLYGGWNNKVDIWALGCSIYFILNNKELFPQQKTDVNSKKQRKKIIERKIINCLLDWCKYDKSHIPINPYNIKYNELKKKIKINKSLMRMLIVDPIKRCDIYQVFNNINLNKEDTYYYINKNLCSPLNLVEMKSIDVLGLDRGLKKILINIYSAYKYTDNILNLNDDDLLSLFLSIAKRLLMYDHCPPLSSQEIDLINLLQSLFI